MNRRARGGLARRVRTALLMALTAATGLSALPAQAHGDAAGPASRSGPAPGVDVGAAPSVGAGLGARVGAGLGTELRTDLGPGGGLGPGPGSGPGPIHGTVRGDCAGTAPVVCHFALPPGTYEVTALLGGATAGRTAVTAESRRTVLAETATAPGRTVRRGFTVDVRDPEGEPTGPVGSPGLDLRFGGAAPLLAALRVTPAPRAPRLFLAGDSTVCDQAAEPYSGWGQQLPRYLRQGISVANYADSGEGSQSFLDNPALFPAIEARVRPGDLVLVQLAHNDKQTPADVYRANLTAMAERVRERGGRPVLVTPVVRRWFNTDGTLANGTALHVNGLGVDLPAEMRALAARLDAPLVDLTALTRSRVEEWGPEASKALFLYDEKRDNTHTSERGATEFAALVLGELRAQGLVRASMVRGAP
ncbi:rhamnogalacturonan acetylesterase [Streptomyces sp. NRRL F-5135]|uniref:rhamnogalacturonan acetylesterase n=1 Tax=Streptomyces sp. NRRL F-5135 TaxID=1463858 RepID=UPI0007C4B299|nr:rhamnogalacturonan acetylesterase [Streptomyces sp. NRRL F-5135]